MEFRDKYLKILQERIELGNLVMQSLSLLKKAQGNIEDIAKISK